MSTFICLYQGVPGECCECGGQSTNGTRYCSHDCAASAQQRADEIDRAIAQRRTREDLFAAEGAKLRVLGRTDEEIDVLLAGIPT